MVVKNWHKKPQAFDVQMLAVFGGDPGEARTLDPLIKSQLLYQLSYGVRRKNGWVKAAEALRFGFALQR